MQTVLSQPGVAGEALCHPSKCRVLPAAPPPSPLAARQRPKLLARPPSRGRMRSELASCPRPPPAQRWQQRRRPGVRPRPRNRPAARATPPQQRQPPPQLHAPPRGVSLPSNPPLLPLPTRARAPARPFSGASSSTATRGASRCAAAATGSGDMGTAMQSLLQGVHRAAVCGCGDLGGQTD